jgi:hypothetical protein
MESGHPERPAPYSHPVGQLLTRGEPGFTRHEWDDYPALGLTDEHVPELIRMAGDGELLWTVTDGEEQWAPVHAWRALGQLRAEAAVEPLLDVLDRAVDADWTMQDLPYVFGMIGPAAVPVLARYLADVERYDLNRGAVADGLREIAEAHPETHEEVVAALMRQMEKWYRSPAELNSLVMSALVDLGVREAAPLIEQAFEADLLDPTLRGDWEDVQVDLGLIPERTTPRPKWTTPLWRLRPSGGLPSPQAKGSKRDKEKSRRKAARESRKRNRRRR